MNIHWNPGFWKITFPSKNIPGLPQRLLFSCCSKLWTFACLGIVSANVLYTDEVKGCVFVQDLALGPPCEQVSWPTCVWVSLVTARHLPIAWVCFHGSAWAFVWFWFGFEIHIFSSVFLYSFREVIPSYQMFFLCSVVAESTGGNGQWLEMGMNQTCSALLWM